MHPNPIKSNPIKDLKINNKNNKDNVYSRKVIIDITYMPFRQRKTYKKNIDQGNKFMCS